jgi:hypothetical protein
MARKAAAAEGLDADYRTDLVAIHIGGAGERVSPHVAPERLGAGLDTQRQAVTTAANALQHIIDVT